MKRLNRPDRDPDFKYGVYEFFFDEKIEYGTHSNMCCELIFKNNSVYFTFTRILGNELGRYDPSLSKRIVEAYKGWQFNKEMTKILVED